MSFEYCLKRNIVIEPLVARYRASAYLTSPCTAPKFLRHLVKRLLSSFVQSPRIHALALKNKAMQGGPFVGLQREKAHRAMFLYQHQLDDLKNLFEFADAQDQLWCILKQATGESLEHYIDKIPLALKRFVELFYERSGVASYRMLEGLLYLSNYYRTDLQEVLMYPIHSDEREFALTTPHIEKSDRLFLKVPFHSACIDQLSMSRFYPIQSLEQLAYDCGVGTDKVALFESYFNI